MLVFVLNKHGKPLMPCRPSKVRKLLKTGKAKVIKRTPFTIQLLYGSSGYKQPVSLGIDAGSKVIGLSATTEKSVLFEAEVELRNDIVKLLADRKETRRSRRYRKTRYRKARFLNRKRPKGWLAPSVQNKINTHLKVIAMVYKILPVSSITMEVASFDIQKIKNPEVSGVQYQQGEQLGFWNVREYVLWRDNYQCQGRKGCRPCQDLVGISTKIFSAMRPHRSKHQHQGSGLDSHPTGGQILAPTGRLQGTGKDNTSALSQKPLYHLRGPWLSRLP